MSFWSSQTLLARLEELVIPAHESIVDCNAVTLTVGSEIYVTPSLEEVNSQTKRKLLLGEPFLLPPGQFAFLMTQEVVCVPTNAMAFISMKATFKMKGLVNVSGFHVDPGWKGELIFAVFNAGPSPIHLQQGLPLFLIWYADLDEPSQRSRNKLGDGVIPPQIINNLSGGVDSVYQLKSKIESEVKARESEDAKLEGRMRDLEKAQAKLETVKAVLISLVVAVFFLLISANSKISSVESSVEQSKGASRKSVP